MKRPSPAPISHVNPHTLQSFGRTSRQTPSFKAGQSVWVLYKEEGEDPFYLACFVINLTEPGYVDVGIIDTEPLQFLRAPISAVLEADTNFTHNDTAELDALNFPNVLETIRCRFALAALEEDQKHFIYTYAGWVLFAVNPYAPCDHIYGPDWCERYFRKTITQEPPHPFAIASTAFTRLIADRVPQYILISGESGGGKTECSKHILKYLTWVTRRQRRLRGRVSLNGPADSAERLAELLVAANPLLEFFGNAKTARNDNSSRFGKLFQVYYDANGEHLLSARLSTYLLAKSRVVQVPAGEENYHVFHSFMSLDKHTLQVMHITEDFTSPFLGESQAHLYSPYYQPGGYFDLETLCNTLTIFGLDEQYQVAIFRVLAAILHLGNVQFQQLPNQDRVQVSNPEVLKIICELLGAGRGATRLQEILTTKQIREARSFLSVSQCKHMTFALAKGLYEALFDYLVGVVRRTLASTGAGVGFNENDCIGVLDLFGFENMEPQSENGFEQLCINYANEQLHHHFLREVLEKENQIYEAEGLMLSASAFGDIEQLVHSEALTVLLGSRASPGIFKILEDACRVQSRDPDGTFVRQVNTMLNTFRPPSPGKRRNGAQTRHFTVNHFAEPVTYTADGFSDRNQDYMPEELCKFLTTQTSTYVQMLFPPDESILNNAKKPSIRSLSATFIKQMSNLTTGLEKTSCYFIKCLKPNDLQLAFEFNPARVLRQLTTGGVGPVLELMKEGYPCRVKYDSLWNKFASYLPSDIIMKLNARDFTELTMNFLRLLPDEYRLGVSRVFFRFGVLQKIEGILLDFDEKMATQFREEMRSWYLIHTLKRAVSAMLASVLLRKALWRVRYKRVMTDLLHHFNTVILPLKMDRAARQIQRAVRLKFCFIKRVRPAIRRVQRYWRLYQARKRITPALAEARRGRCAQVILSLLMAAHYRIEAVAAAKFHAALRIQALFRGWSVRKLIRERVQEAARQASAARLQRWWRKILRTGRHRRPPAPSQQYSGYTPTRMGVMGVGPGSVLRGTAKPSFMDAKDRLEMRTQHPELGEAEINAEVKRRRRSIFADTNLLKASVTRTVTRLACSKVGLSPQASGCDMVERDAPFHSPAAIPPTGWPVKGPPKRSNTFQGVNAPDSKFAGSHTPFAPASVQVFNQGRPRIAQNDPRPTPVPKAPNQPVQHHRRITPDYSSAEAGLPPDRNSSLADKVPEPVPEETFAHTRSQAQRPEHFRPGSRAVCTATSGAQRFIRQGSGQEFVPSRQAPPQNRFGQRKTSASDTSRTGSSQGVRPTLQRQPSGDGQHPFAPSGYCRNRAPSASDTNRSSQLRRLPFSRQGSGPQQRTGPGLRQPPSEAPASNRLQERINSRLGSFEGPNFRAALRSASTDRVQVPPPKKGSFDQTHLQRNKPIEPPALEPRSEPAGPPVSQPSFRPTSNTQRNFRPRPRQAPTSDPADDTGAPPVKSCTTLRQALGLPPSKSTLVSKPLSEDQEEVSQPPIRDLNLRRPAPTHSPVERGGRDSLLASEPTSLLNSRYAERDTEHGPEVPTNSTMGAGLCKPSRDGRDDPDVCITEKAAPLVSTTTSGVEGFCGESNVSLRPESGTSLNRASVRAWMHEGDPNEGNQRSASGTEAEEPEQTPLFGQRETFYPSEVLTADPVKPLQDTYMRKAKQYNEKENTTPRPFQSNGHPSNSGSSGDKPDGPRMVIPRVRIVNQPDIARARQMQSHRIPRFPNKEPARTIRVAKKSN